MFEPSIHCQQAKSFKTYACDYGFLPRGGGELPILSDRDETIQKQEQTTQKVVIQSQPQLHQGINLLRKPGKLPVFQALVAEELKGRNASAVWIDSKNESSTYALSSFGGPVILEKVHIGRAFTPFQHHKLVQQLEDFIQEDTEMLVLPNISHLYLDGQVQEWEAEELFQETWQKILEVKKKYGLKVLVSVPETNSSLNYVVQGDSDNEIEVERTDQGWKYESDDFEQLAYQEGDVIQTTVSYWKRKTSKTVKVAAKQRS